MDLPLSGLRVLDFTHAAAGPFATMFLADLGAEVVKIEHPIRGDGARTMGVPMPGHNRSSDYFLSLNRNKKGLAIDLSSDRGAGLARGLAAKSDVVAQNFRPGVIDRLGLGFDDLTKLRSHLVYCSISAFGDEGPWAGRPANDIILQSVSGLMGVTGEVNGGPVRIGAPVADYSAGLFALTGILSALYARASFPEGQHVKISMLESCINLLCNYIPSVVDLGTRVPRLGRAHAQIVPYQAFRCADGQYVMVGAFTRAFWTRLCRAIGHDEWITDSRFVNNAARLQHRDELVGVLEGLFAVRPRQEWLDILEAADVPASPILELDETVRLEQVEAAGSIIPVSSEHDTFHVARSPIRAGQWPEADARIAPALGLDTGNVLGDLLGLDEEEIDDLRASGVIVIPDRGGQADDAA